MIDYRNKDCNFYLKCFFLAMVVCFCMDMGGCSSNKPVNCLTFADSYSKLTDSELIVGIYKPGNSVYHAWVERKDGMCMDQMRIFECDDVRYKELATPNDIQVAALMGSRL